HTDALSLEQDMGFMGGLDSVLDFSGLTDLSAITADASSLSGPVIVAEAQSISVTNLSDNTSSAQMEALDLSDNAQAPVMELSVESAIDLNAQEVSLQEAIDLAGSIDQNLEAPVLDVPGTVLSEAGSVGTSGGHISQEALAQANTAGSDVFDVWADAETVSDQLFLNEVAQLSDNMT
ncbi:MAG: hypothetical protein KJO88_06235, partial [Gammaproteobacteria bacterium]|nr:hypothetical protein [Gammaproteobacteria bacterium]